MSTPSHPSVQTDRFVHDRLPPPDQWPQMRYELPELQIPAQANLVDVLFERADKRGLSDRPFLRSDKIILSYADAHERVKRIAQVLTEDLQLVPGNRVLLRGGNTIGMALAWLGVVKAGLVAVATMPLLRAKELGEIIAKSQATVALCDASLLAELQAARDLGEILLMALIKERAGRTVARFAFRCGAGHGRLTLLDPRSPRVTLDQPGLPGLAGLAGAKIAPPRWKGTFMLAAQFRQLAPGIHAFAWPLGPTRRRCARIWRNVTLQPDGNIRTAIAPRPAPAASSFAWANFFRSSASPRW